MFTVWVLIRRRQWSAIAYLAGWAVVSRLPRMIVWPFFRWGADRACRHGVGAEQLRRNLTRVVGPANVTRKLVRDSMRSYARYWLEAFQLPRLSRDNELDRRIHVDEISRSRLDESFRSGDGMILVLPHSGNWDMAGWWLARRCGTFTTVAERLKPEPLFDAFVRFREGLGFTVIPLTGGDHPPMAALAETLRHGGIVCLLGERDFSGTGVPVSLCGEATTFPAGPAVLAHQTGARLHVVDCHFGGSVADPEWFLGVEPVISVTKGDTVENTAQRIADAMSVHLRAHPTDWHALQPVWTADRRKRR